MIRGVSERSEAVGSYASARASCNLELGNHREDSIIVAERCSRVALSTSGR